MSFKLISPPCLNNISNTTGGCSDQIREPEWLDIKIFGVPTWQLIGVFISVILAITIMICCCVRFRIPRTKQEIEADYIRKKLTRNFRKELSKLSDKEMDEMDLKKALDRLRDVFGAVRTDETEIEEKKVIYEKTNRGLTTKFNAMFRGMRVRFNKEESTGFNTMI
ncbi:hypothetical protein QAD02_004099 [Eretmocerus hayati]|uniref:Uncharacterized protein n=1 Tax=Eretmocerus hayati TaxID=131215 RepID=A0ACC2NP29_9HYME|nr:hypothetical protein QAD02_004099 [Eretmocerus hayati]